MTHFEKYFHSVFDFFAQNHSKTEPLDLCLEHIRQENKQIGLCVELGVWKGQSIQKIYDTLPQFDIYGFDSFTGLPEKWREFPLPQNVQLGPIKKEGDFRVYCLCQSSHRIKILL